MEQQRKQLNLPRLMLLTGFAFVIGGFFRTFMEWLLSQANEGETVLQILLAIWFGFLVEAAIGMAALTYLLRSVYPPRKLWLAGTGAFALGIFIPALLINQFFYALLILPGLLVGFFFSLLLKEHSSRGIFMLVTTLGFLVCQVLVFLARNDMAWTIWLYENAGYYSVTILLQMVQNMIIGASMALSAGLMINNLKKN